MANRVVSEIHKTYKLGKISPCARRRHKRRAIASLTKTATAVVALEGKPHGIRALAVCPAAVETPLWDHDAPADVRRRMMKSAQVAEVVRWLVTAPRNLDFGPVIVRNFEDPWMQ